MRAMRTVLLLGLFLGAFVSHPVMASPPNPAPALTDAQLDVATAAGPFVGVPPVVKLSRFFVTMAQAKHAARLAAAKLALKKGGPGTVQLHVVAVDPGGKSTASAHAAAVGAHTSVSVEVAVSPGMSSSSAHSSSSAK